MTVEAFFDAIKNISTTINFDLNYNKKNESYKLIRRYLPQTARSVAFLFPRVPVTESNSVNFTNEFITVRETSNVHDAILAYNSYSANAVAAFRNLNFIWTKNQERPFELVHYHSDNDQLVKELGTKKIQSLIDSFALQLNPPSDIFELLSQEVGTESMLRRVDALYKKELYHGFPNSWEYVLALKFYAEVVTMELIKRHQHTDWQRVTFSTRNNVDSIAEDCANFVLKSYSDGIISSFSWSDPATFATETRIYTQLLMSRIHAFRDVNNGTATALKMVASALKNIARSKKLDWQAIPSEQLASLRMSYKHGEIAFERVSKVLTDTRSDLASHALSLSTASYPVLLLRGEPPEEERWKQDGKEPLLEVGTTPSWIGARETTEDDLTILRMRFESLRINFDTDGKEGIERRLEALSVSNLSTPLEYGHFFVPFTYGDHLPTLSSTIVPAFMFSSVPVSCKSVINAIDKTIQSLSGKPQGTLLELVPSFTRCRSMEAAYVIDNPSEILYDKDRIRFLCSYVENEDTNLPQQTPTKTAEESANSAVMSTFTESLSDVYSSIAWNAERVQQSILLARSCNGNIFDIRLPSSSSTAFVIPLQPQLEKELRSIKAEILYQTRACIYTIRREVVKLAMKVNAIFVEQIEQAKGLVIAGSGATIQSHGVADVAVWSDDNMVAPSIATGDETPTAPIDEYLLFSTRNFSDDEISTHTRTIYGTSFSFVNKLSKLEYDYRKIVRDFGSTETIKDWIFQPQYGLLKPDVDTTKFTFRAGDTAGEPLKLEDIKDDKKREWLTETLLNFEAIFRLEAPFRMLDYLLSKLDDVEIKLSKAKEVQKNPNDIHSVVFRRNFTASVVIGQAICFDVLGETKSPSLSRMRTGSESLTYDGIDDSEAADLSKRLEKLKTKVNDASKTIATLRLSELCAITHTTLSEELV